MQKYQYFQLIIYMNTKNASEYFSILQIAAKSPDMNVWIAKETERNNKHTVVLPSLLSEWKQLRVHVFTYTCYQTASACMCCSSKLWIFICILGIRPIGLFLQFSREIFNDMFKSVFYSTSRSVWQTARNTDTAIIQTWFQV